MLVFQLLESGILPKTLNFARQPSTRPGRTAGQRRASDDFTFDWSVIAIAVPAGPTGARNRQRPAHGTAGQVCTGGELRLASISHASAGASTGSPFER